MLYVMHQIEDPQDNCYASGGFITKSCSLGKANFQLKMLISLPAVLLCF